MAKLCHHNHFKSEFDAVDSIKKYLQAALDAGYDAISITDHGSVAAMDDVYDLVSPENSPYHDLKIIYGTEAYIELTEFPIDKKTGHMILLARDKKGKVAIGKLLSKAALTNSGKPVITRAMLEEYQPMFKGHVFATSACIAGAPAMAFQNNAVYDKEILRLQNRRQKLIANAFKNDEERQDFIYNADKIQAEFDEIVAQVVALRKEKADLKKLSKKSFAAMEKKVEKLKKVNDPTADAVEKEMDNLKIQAAQATDQITDIDARIDTLWIQKGKLNEKLHTFGDLKKKLAEIDKDIATCESLLTSEEECMKKAEKEMLYFDNIFGHKRYFCELQYHGIPEEAAIYPKLAKIAKEHNIPMVVANDAHVPTKSEADLNKRRVAMFLRFEKVSSEEEDKTNSEMYIKTQDELKEMLLQILPEDIVNTAIKNTNQLAEYCKYKPEKESHYPVFDKNQDSNALLRKLAYEGIDWRFPNHEGFTQEYQDRLEYELDVICNMGYADYHLIVKDFLEYARACGPIPSQYLDDAPLTIEGVKEYCKEHNWDVGIGVGIGRGSAAGSLVCYLIGITGIDPLKYDLIFERFLNVERISLPDIDSDFRPDIREKTVKYVQNRYGHDAVVSILTESREGVKGAIRDAARYLGKRDFDESTYYLSLGNTIRSKVPNILNISFDTVVDEETNETCFDYMNGLFENDTNAKKILALAKDIEGMFTTYGMHAAGVIIPDTDDITDYIPLRWNPKKERYTTQCNMVQAENNGLLKMDFLGLKNLGIFTDAIQMIEEQENVKIDLSQLEFDDAVFSEIYAKGRTKNVFQFESPGMRKYLKELNPTSIEDIVAMNALYRPGPIDSIPEFIAAKNKGL